MRLEFQRNRIRRRWRLGKQVRRILVVRLARMGDVLRASAVVRRLREQVPGCRDRMSDDDATLPAFRRNSALSAVYTLKDDGSPTALRLDGQPPESLPAGEFPSRLGADVSADVLEHVAPTRRRFIRAVRSSTVRRSHRPTFSIAFRRCEELFLIALMNFDPDRYPRTDLEVDEQAARCGPSEVRHSRRPTRRWRSSWGRTQSAVVPTKGFGPTPSITSRGWFDISTVSSPSW